MYIIMEWIGGAAVSPISAMAGHFHSNVVIHSSAIQGLRHVLLAPTSQISRNKLKLLPGKVLKINKSKKIKKSKKS